MLALTPFVLDSWLSEKTRASARAWNSSLEKYQDQEADLVGARAQLHEGIAELSVPYERTQELTVSLHRQRFDLIRAQVDLRVIRATILKMCEADAKLEYNRAIAEHQDVQESIREAAVQGGNPNPRPEIWLNHPAYKQALSHKRSIFSATNQQESLARNSDALAELFEEMMALFVMDSAERERIRAAGIAATELQIAQNDSAADVGPKPDAERGGRPAVIGTSPDALAAAVEPGADGESIEDPAGELSPATAG